MFPRSERRACGDDQEAGATFAPRSSRRYGLSAISNHQALPDAKRLAGTRSRESFEPILGQSLRRASECRHQLVRLANGGTKAFKQNPLPRRKLDDRMRSLRFSRQPFGILFEPLRRHAFSPDVIWLVDGHCVICSGPRLSLRAATHERSWFCPSIRACER